MPMTDPLQSIYRLASQLAELPVHHLFGRGPRRQPHLPGAPPGTLFVDEEAKPTRISAWRYDEHGIEKLTDTSPQGLVEARRSDTQLWIDVAGLADTRTIQTLNRLLSVHHLATADVVNVPQRPKIQRIGEHRLIIGQIAHLEPESQNLGLGQIAIILGPDYLITYRQIPGDLFRPIMERFAQPDSRLRRERVDYLAWAILDLLTDSFFPIVESLSDQIDALEEVALDAGGGRLIARIHNHRRLLILLSRILWRNRDMIHSLMRNEGFMAAELKPFLYDLQDHAAQLLDMVETVRELANSLVEIHLAFSSYRMNEIMKTLTVMASIFIPLTFLAGLYGMNFEHMPELAWPWAYPAVLGLMAGVAIGLLFWFRRRGWIGGGRGRRAMP